MREAVHAEEQEELPEKIQFAAVRIELQLQASGIRRLLLQDGAFLQIHAFPQKDNPARRVFKDAKLSAVFIYRKGLTPGEEPTPFPSVRHQANTINAASPSLHVRTSEIPLYDPSNLAILSCAQEDWDLAVRVAQRPGFRRLGRLCKSYQGEVNETTDEHFLSDRLAPNRSLVLRGSNVCMYVLRGASQGEALYLDATAYQKAKANSEKAFHTRADRVGFQRSAPQNNYRRVIAAYVPAGEFCFDTVSYVPRGNSTFVSLDLLLALLNSLLIDWYFSIGSTNSKVNEYQFNNLPCPVFRAEVTAADTRLGQKLIELSASDPAAASDLVGTVVAGTPFNSALAALLEDLARRIRAVENARGEVSKRHRAHLDPAADALQSLIDDVLFQMAGFSVSEVQALRDRMAQMA
jgi:hypothetical protein